MELLTEKQASEILKISAYALGELRRRGKSPPYIKLGGQVRYLKETLKKWIKAQEGRES